jgi:hypothetical protein
LTRNQMELLELEMRARAIKAMLKTAKWYGITGVSADKSPYTWLNMNNSFS